MCTYRRPAEALALAFKRFRSSADINDAGPEAALSHLRQMASEIHRVTKTIALFDGVTSQADEFSRILICSGPFTNDLQTKKDYASSDKGSVLRR